MQINKFNGLIAAPFTPMDNKGNVLPGLVPKLANSLKQNQILGAFIIGSTGEGVSLTFDEKKDVIEAWMQEQDEDFKVIALIASNSLREGKELARFAAKTGLYGIAVLPPYYFKIKASEDLVSWCKELASAVPDLPVYYYHIPALTGVQQNMYDFIKMADDQIDNFAGIKYTAPDLYDYRKCITYRNGRYDILWGMDETLLGAMAMGARGGVGSTYNYAAPLYIEMMHAYHLGDMAKAQRLQSKSIAIVDVLVRHGGIKAGKHFMKHIGLDCGLFRSPVGGMVNEFEFNEDLKRIEFDRYSSLVGEIPMQV